ncbi:TetR/AcrR family transcriptional regulator [Tropicibacter naphthalenivorans]|nr:TetR/AcrR family transcriptional regulator [Tropicibacter naphthalenivorans]
MGNTREEKRADLLKRLIDAAEAEIIEHGLAGLKARAVTTRAGCALGALYNAVQDLDMLVLHVNSRTLNNLGTELRIALPPKAAPVDTMQALASAYADFATRNRNLWIALFEHRLPPGVDAPDWHKKDHAVLIEVLLPTLGKLRPDLDKDALILRARTTFAAVHGVVLLSLQGRFVGVPADVLKSEIAALVTAMTRGLQATPE